MSASDLTAEQKAAVEHEAGDACVIAGAGSGKTTVLTARFATLCGRDQVRARRVAALTFTDKAANEMRRRIARAFADSEDPRLREQARDVEFSPIQTIHAFGARLLREQAVAAGIDPAFVLLDEHEAELLAEEAWDEVARRLRRRADPRRAVLSRIGGEDAWRTLIDLHQELRGLGLDPGAARVAPGTTPLPDALATLQRAIEDLDAAVAMKPLKSEAAEAYAATRKALPLPEALRSPTDEAARRVGDAVIEAAVSKNRLIALPSKTAKEQRDALIEAYAAVEGALLDARAATSVDGPVRGLLAELDAAYEARKRERGALDYQDLERRTLALLDTLEREGRPLEGRPQRLLLDEAQDTNPLQARILERLRRPSVGRAADFFAVGDPQQSIYRFRRADVTVLQREFEAAGSAGTRLTESFRSRPELVGFYNEMFSRLLTKDAAGVDFQRMSSRGKFHDGGPFPPEVLVVEGGTSGKAPLDLEAAAVARRVRAWVDGGALRTKKEKGPDGVEIPMPRPLRWGDVAILVRTHEKVRAFERALLAAGIPFHVGKGRGFYDTPEILDLLHLLRVVHDPLDAFAVAAWLASPAVGASDQDLLDVFGTKGSPLEKAAKKPSLAPAVRRIRELRSLAAGASLESTVRRAVEEADAVPTSLLQPGGMRRARNLEKAVAIARRLDDEGGHGLFDFLRRLTDLKDREVDEPEASAGGEEDSVALLTVHAAKGLEWPCVVVAGASFPPRSEKGSFLLDPEGRVAWKLVDPLEGRSRPTGAFEARKEVEKSGNAQESLRLLYVAMTRAEERLLVSWSFAKRRDSDHAPAKIGGWAQAIADALGDSMELGARSVALGTSKVNVTVEVPAEEVVGEVSTAPWFRRLGASGCLEGPVAGLDEKTLAQAKTLWASVSRPVETLGRTPFVVTISDLLAYARSPADFYLEKIVGGDDDAPGAALVTERDDPGSGAEDGPLGDPSRVERWDEGREKIDGIDRAALGKAVHLALERYSVGADERRLVEEAVAEEFPPGDHDAVSVIALGMVRRFLESATGRTFQEALRSERKIRREVAFHARIPFPGAEKVGPFDSLLVKGSIDLWLPDADGKVRILDFKTNAPGSRFPDGATVARHYATQVRLYALAAQGVLEGRVAGAGLLLLDPAWAACGVGVEVEVDVSEARLVEARALCRDFARSMLEGTWARRSP